MPANKWAEYKAKANLYFTNQKLLKLYQTLRQNLGEKMMRMDVNDNHNNLDSFTEELHNVVQIERNLIKNTKQQRADLLNGIKTVIGWIGVLVVAVLYMYVKIMAEYKYNK